MFCLRSRPTGLLFRSSQTPIWRSYTSSSNTSSGDEFLAEQQRRKKEEDEQMRKITEEHGKKIAKVKHCMN